MKAFSSDELKGGGKESSRKLSVCTINMYKISRHIHYYDMLGIDTSTYI